MVSEAKPVLAWETRPESRKTLDQIPPEAPLPLRTPTASAASFCVDAPVEDQTGAVCFQFVHARLV